jgi:pSer/pThr/pTyr-binding forkhead associated (FHA) protein
MGIVNEHPWHEGRAEVAPAVQVIARALQTGYPAPLTLLTGLRMYTPDGKEAIADLILLTNSAVLVGINAERANATLPPRELGREVLRRQQVADLNPVIQVYACWLGVSNPEGVEDRSPLLSNASQVAEFLRRSGAQNNPVGDQVVSKLAAHLLAAESVKPAAGERAAMPASPVQIVLSKLPRGWRRQIGVRPADVSKQLRTVLLDRRHHLEDAQYGKVAPNVYTVAVNPQQYAAHFEPIGADLCEQWRRQLLQDLNTANSRQGRKQYRFGGAVAVQLKADAGLPTDEIRIEAQVQREPQAERPDPGPVAEPQKPPTGATMAAPAASHGWLLAEGNAHPLKEGTNILGRSRSCDVIVSGKEVTERRLVSGLHAYIECRGGNCRIFDGTPDGKPSMNGTFVNVRPVSQGGQPLRDGDEIILAALDRASPRPDTPGVAWLLFHNR